MSLPSRRDINGTTTYLLYATRASPLVCVTNALELIFYLAFELLHGMDLRLAALVLCSSTTENYYKIYYSTQHVSKSSIRQFPKTSIVVFIGVLTQIVKLLGYRILTWPKVVAAMYAIPYVLQAALILIATEPDGETSPRERSIKQASLARVHSTFKYWLSWTLFMLSTVGSLAVSSVAVKEIYQVQDLKTSRQQITSEGGTIDFSFWIAGRLITNVVVVMFAVTAIITLTLTPAFYLATKPQEPPHATARCVFATTICLLAQGLIAYYVAKFVDFPENDPDNQRCNLFLWLPNCFGIAVLIFGVAIFATWFLSRILIVAVRTFGRRTEKQQGCAMMGIAMAHLVVAVLYGTYGYESTGTIKPAWTDKLG